MTAPAVPLLGYQKRWFLDPARFKIGMFARQTGKTFSTALEIVDDCFEAEAAGRRARWVILSRGERQAEEAMNEGVKLHARAYSMAVQEIEGEFVGGDGARYKQFDVLLPGGSRITALPANPDTARGYSANVFLDEFAIHKDSRAIWAALFPVVSKGALKLRVTSTPKGKGNKFYELMTGQEAGKVWSRHIVDIHQAVREGLDRDIDALRAGLNDPDLWAQEYELQWLDEASAWLSFDLINAVEHDQAGLPALYQGGPCYVGVDIAVRNDLFVIWVAERLGDTLWTREVIVRQRIKFAEQDFLLDGVFKRYKVIRCHMDQTGMGEKPVEDAQRRYGSGRVQGVLFTAAAKQELATVGKQRFEDRTIRINEGDMALRSDLHALKRVPTVTGAARFLVDGETDGHGDRAWACFLACHAAQDAVIPAGAEVPPDRDAYRPRRAVERSAQMFGEARPKGGLFGGRGRAGRGG